MIPYLNYVLKLVDVDSCIHKIQMLLLKTSLDIQGFKNPFFIRICVHGLDGWSTIASETTFKKDIKLRLIDNTSFKIWVHTSLDSL